MRVHNNAIPGKTSIAWPEPVLAVAHTRASYCLHLAISAPPCPIPYRTAGRYRSASPIISRIVARNTLTAVSPRRLSSSVHR
jgi:hypothetical protein